MDKFFLEGIKIGAGFIFIVSFFAVVSASGWHIAGQIYPGTFSSGDFVFDGGVNVTAGNDFCIVGANCLSSSGGSLWSLSGSEIYYDSGLVGIGTDSPSESLEVMGIVKTDDIIIDNQQSCSKLYTNSSGYVLCGVDANSGGDITGVTAGTGLTGGGTSGSVTLDADATYLQRRVSSTCAAGSSIRVINADGTVTCQTDANSGGDITGVTAGTGLTGGGTSGSVTITADATYLQRRVSGTCAAGSAIRAVGATGTVTCESTSITCSCGTCWATAQYGDAFSGYYYQMCTPAGWKRTSQTTGGSGTCLVAGTPVLMGDYSLKSVEDVKIDDYVINSDGEVEKVADLWRTTIGDRGTYVINGKIEVTPDHPFMTAQGWKVISLEMLERTQKNLGLYPNIEATKLEVGDVLIVKDGMEIVESIEANNERPFNEIVYSLILENGDSFYANGYLVADAR